MTALRVLILCPLLSLFLTSWVVLSAPAAEKRLLQDEWQQWKTRHGKTYADPAHELRAHALWSHHWGLVQSHNSRSDVTFTLEVNAFADQEFRRETRMSNSHTLRYVPEMTSKFLPRGFPPSFDWRKKGDVTPVRNQGQLGQADAFAVTEDLESLHAINTGQLVELSVAEVVDCCSLNPGMLVSDVYECIARHGGLCSEAAYPHTHPPPHSCRNDSCQAVAKDAHRTVLVPPRNESAMLEAVLKCPLVVYVDASHVSFQLYQAGVYREPQCGHTVDHVMQLVGYGSDQGHDYWILKNSWGAAWGMQGYMWMERGVNMCGVADRPLYPQ